MINFAPFDIDPLTGFLPNPDPLTHLPPYFAAWDALGAQLPVMLLARKTRAYIAAMPLLDVNRLEGRGQRERAMLLLTTFANAFVWGEPQVATRIPASLAVPLCRVSALVGRKPIISHASNVLYNWLRIDASGSIDLDNLTTLQPFLGSSDEAWFVLVTVAIEARGAAALSQLVRAQAAVVAGDTAEVSSALTQIAQTVEVMTRTLLRMYEQCDPHVFFHRVRPFLAAWPAPGVIYEGVSAAPMIFAGGSAAQSSLVQALDAALGVQHTSERSRPFLHEMRGYMPPGHRRFIETLECGPDMAAFVHANRTTAPLLMDNYNHVIDLLSEFRRQHMEVATRYITMQAPKPEAALGTGGTDFAHFLDATKRETRARRLS